jgi:hypothetical protein
VAAPGWTCRRFARESADLVAGAEQQEGSAYGRMLSCGLKE